MSARGSKLGRQQERAIAALLTEKTHAEAAARVGIAAATLQRWLLLPEFRSAYREARRQVVEAAVGRLQAASSRAVDCLERNLECGRPASEIRAALGILDHALKAVELMDLAGRVEELEQRLTGGADAGAGAEAEAAGGPGPDAGAGGAGGDAPVDPVPGREPPPEAGPGEPG